MYSAMFCIYLITLTCLVLRKPQHKYLSLNILCMRSFVNFLRPFIPEGLASVLVVPCGLNGGAGRAGPAWRGAALRRSCGAAQACAGTPGRSPGWGWSGPSVPTDRRSSQLKICHLCQGRAAGRAAECQGVGLPSAFSRLWAPVSARVTGTVIRKENVNSQGQEEDEGKHALL